MHNNRGWFEAQPIDLAVHNPLGPVPAAAGPFDGRTRRCAPTDGGNVMELAASAPPGPFDAGCHPRAGRLEAGCQLSLDKPGPGIEIDREALQRYPSEMTELPHFRREDGAVTNW